MGGGGGEEGGDSDISLSVLDNVNRMNLGELLTCVKEWVGKEQYSSIAAHD